MVLISCFTFYVFLMLFVISWLCALCALGALHPLLAICSCCFSTLLCYVFMPLFGIFLCVFLLFLGSFSNWLSLFLLFVQVWKKFFSHLFSTTNFKVFFKKSLRQWVLAFFHVFLFPLMCFAIIFLASIAFDKVGFHFFFHFFVLVSLCMFFLCFAIFIFN